MDNATAMLNLYCKAHPDLNRRECLELMKEKEAHFFGLDGNEELKKLANQENIRRGTFYKKRKKRR